MPYKIKYDEEADVLTVIVMEKGKPNVVNVCWHRRQEGFTVF